jgi:hypothetical protein
VASRTPKRNAGGRFARCVAQVSKRRGVVSPRGVCAAAGRKKYGAKKFAAMAAAGKRKAKRKNTGAAGWRAKGHGTPGIATPDNVVKVSAPRKKNAGKKKTAAKVRGRKNSGRTPARRTNPLEAAKKVYRKFHGRDADNILTITEPMHVHKHLSGIGDLVGLQVLTHDGRAKVTLKFDDGAVLAQNEKRNQLFIRGGDQSVNLKDFGITGPHHELEDLGAVIWVSYFTRKDHLAPEDGGEAIYKHRFGRKKPTLIYDTLNKKMELAGGGYDIPDEGIDK